MSDVQGPLSFDAMGIQRCQRNRHPLLFLDQVTEVVPGKRAVGRKCFTFNEWFFPAHFDDEPNVPGFIQVECMVQAFIMTFLCKKEYQGMKTSFVSIDGARFRRKIVPGEVLEIRANLDSFNRGVARGSSEAFVGDELACRADFVVCIPDVVNQHLPGKG